MFVLAQGTNSQKGIRDLRDSQVIQEQINIRRICSASCSLQKILINYRPTTLFTHFFILAVYGFREKLNNLEIISVRLWRMGGAGQG